MLLWSSLFNHHNKLLNMLNRYTLLTINYRSDIKKGGSIFDRISFTTKSLRFFFTLTYWTVRIQFIIRNTIILNENFNSLTSSKIDNEIFLKFLWNTTWSLQQSYIFCSLYQFNRCAIKIAALDRKHDYHQINVFYSIHLFEKEFSFYWYFLWR